MTINYFHSSNYSDSVAAETISSNQVSSSHIITSSFDPVAAAAEQKSFEPDFPELEITGQHHD